MVYRHVMTGASMEVLLDLLLVFNSIGPTVSILQGKRASLKASFRDCFPLGRVHLSSNPFLSLRRGNGRCLL